MHIAKERDPQRRSIAAAICDRAQATTYNASRSNRSELDARRACLHDLVSDAAAIGTAMLVLEQDDSPLRWDNTSSWLHGLRVNLTPAHRPDR